MAPPHRPIITITASTTGYVASINDPSLKVRPAHDIKWKVNEPVGFPADGVVFLQFYENLHGQKVNSSGCMVDGVKNNGKQKGEKNGANDHRVIGKVAFNAQGAFLYEIRYSDSGGDYLLLDPEIIVEGTPEPVKDDQPPRDAARSTRRTRGGNNRGQGAKRKAGRKKAGKRSGKKAGQKKGARKKSAAKRAGAARAVKKSTAKKAKKKTAKRRAAKKR